MQIRTVGAQFCEICRGEKVAAWRGSNATISVGQCKQRIPAQCQTYKYSQGQGHQKPIAYRFGIKRNTRAKTKIRGTCQGGYRNGNTNQHRLPSYKGKGSPNVKHFIIAAKSGEETTGITILSLACTLFRLSESGESTPWWGSLGRQAECCLALDATWLPDIYSSRNALGEWS
jgi:hypothetical protein